MKDMSGRHVVVLAEEVFPVKAVGDCNKAQDAAHAIRAAYVAAMKIGDTVS